MMKKLSLALLLLLSLPLASLAQPVAPMPYDIEGEAVCDSSSFSNYLSLRFGNWQDICALGILIAFLMVSLLYMASQAFSNPGLAAWCRKEFFEIMITAVVVASLFWFVNFSCTIFTPSLFVQVGDWPNNMFGYSIKYAEWLRDASYTVYAMVASFNSLLSLMTSSMVYQSPGGFGVNVRPLAGLAGLSGTMVVSMNAILNGGVFLSIIQLRMLRIIYLTMFNIYLPIGVFCRCFEPTRRFGGSLMAIAIGLFLLYPLLVVLNAGVVKGTALGGAPSELDGMAILGEDPFLEVKDYVASTGIYNLDESEFLEQQRLYSESAGDPASGFYDPESGEGVLLINQYHGLFQLFYRVFLKLIVATLFLPLFNFILLITFVRNLSRLLGEEVDVTNITRLI